MVDMVKMTGKKSETLVVGLTRSSLNAFRVVVSHVMCDGMIAFPRFTDYQLQMP